MAEMAEIRADSPMARDSDFFMASRLGTSSPKTKDEIGEQQGDENDGKGV